MISYKISTFARDYHVLKQPKPIKNNVLMGENHSATNFNPLELLDIFEHGLQIKVMKDKST